MTLLQSPEIISFNNGVIEWRHDGARAYVLKLDGVRLGDGVYRSDNYDTGELGGDTRIDIIAADDGGAEISPATSVIFRCKKNILELLPAELELDGETVRWNGIGGVSEYRVVDIDFNATTVFGTSYDMSSKNLVYGVYPVSELSGVKSACAPAGEIAYLAGRGTPDEPYLIKTPFDLRAVDYYEMRCGGTRRNVYRIENDIDYNAVRTLENESNIYTLRKPFFGVLDGGGKKLGGIRVHYDGGYWALFDFIARGAAVKNIVFDNPTVTNELQDKYHPLGASIATVAHRNHGTVTGITVHRASYTASGGAICGIAEYNSGEVSCCTVSGAFKQESTGQRSQACYEMSGIVLENRAGGTVINNRITSLTISGSGCIGDDGSAYNNVRAAAGIVAFNRAGGRVKNNGYTNITMTHILASGSECGGTVAYNAGTVTANKNELGTLKWSAEAHGAVAVTATVGDIFDLRGRAVGKNDGTLEGDINDR